MSAPKSGTIRAQLAQEIPLNQLLTYLQDENWYAEQKLDGHRLLVDVHGGVLVAHNRNGSPYSKRLPPLLDSLPPLSGRWVFDGELLSEEFWVFDVLVAADTVVWMRPFVQRRELLARLAPLLKKSVRLLPSTRDTEEKLRLAMEALRSRAEGLMLKRADGLYQLGARSPKMLKAKFTYTADVIVTELGRDGKDNAVLSMVREDDAEVSLVEVGAASTLGKPFTLRVGDVVEVRFLYATADDRLYQPRLVRLREDKHPRECTRDQLQYASKGVLNLTGASGDHARRELPDHPENGVPNSGTVPTIRPSTDGQEDD